MVRKCVGVRFLVLLAGALAGCGSMPSAPADGAGTREREPLSEFSVRIAGMGSKVVERWVAAAPGMPVWIEVEASEADAEEGRLRIELLENGGGLSYSLEWTETVAVAEEQVVRIVWYEEQPPETLRLRTVERLVVAGVVDRRGSDGSVLGELPRRGCSSIRVVVPPLKGDGPKGLLRWESIPGAQGSFLTPADAERIRVECTRRREIVGDYDVEINMGGMSDLTPTILEVTTGFAAVLSGAAGPRALRWSLSRVEEEHQFRSGSARDNRILVPEIAANHGTATVPSGEQPPLDVPLPGGRTVKLIRCDPAAPRE